MKSLSEIQFNDTANNTANKFSDFTDNGYLLFKSDNIAINNTSNYSLINDSKSFSMYVPAHSAYNQVTTKPLEDDAYQSYLTAETVNTRGNDQYNGNYSTSLKNEYETLSIIKKPSKNKNSSRL
jgi:hypothetical protein